MQPYQSLFHQLEAPFYFCHQPVQKTMTKFLSCILAMLFLGNMAIAQNHFQTLVEREGEKTFKGILGPEVIESDSSFTWYLENQKGYTPNSLALSALKQYGDSIQIIAFVGTWCEDSHYIFPKFMSIVDGAGFSRSRLTIIGVDRSKNTLGNLCAALDVKNVPTFLVTKNGKELGRVVEYGKYGMWDKELGEVITGGFK